MLVNGALINGSLINGPPAQATISAEAAYSSRYTCALTGTTDLTIPIASFQARYRSGRPTYLSVTIPNGADYYDDISDRSDGQLVLTRTIYGIDGTELSSGEVMRVDLEDIELYEGSSSYSITLTGHRTTSNGIPHTVALSGASYRSVKNGSRRYRCSPHNQLRPGDTAQIYGDEFVVDSVSWYASSRSETFEVVEAE
jgi:hypothetical protein